jgi:Ran GTPase-activating protein (RanGAP) involved in mRNA processing and transport
MNYFFEKIMDNQYLYSFNLANVDGLHRNRLGSNGCKGLNKLLKNNKVLAMIDIADNSIGNEGIRNMLKGVDPHESNIAYINLSNNGLSQGCISELSNLLNSSSLQEIRLNENQLNDYSAQELAYFFYRGKCQLAKLDLSYNCLTSNGMGILSHALKLNPYLTHLNLENNHLSRGDKFSKITIMLKSNKILKYLNLSKCELGCVEAEAIADGLSENKALETLNLSKNRIMDKGASLIFESLQCEKTRLINLDLSSNSIHNEAIGALIGTLNVNEVIQKISLYNNMITESVGRSLSVAVKNNNSIHVLNLGHNSIEKQDMIQIKDSCK